MGRKGEGGRSPTEHREESFERDDGLEPVGGEWASFGDWVLVGNGKPTNEYCGSFLGFKGCLNVDKHNVVTLEGENFTGKVFVRRVQVFVVIAN